MRGWANLALWTVSSIASPSTAATTSLLWSVAMRIVGCGAAARASLRPGNRAAGALRTRGRWLGRVAEPLETQSPFGHEPGPAARAAHVRGRGAAQGEAVLSGHRANKQVLRSSVACAPRLAPPCTRQEPPQPPAERQRSVPPGRSQILPTTNSATDMGKAAIAFKDIGKAASGSPRPRPQRARERVGAGGG